MTACMYISPPWDLNASRANVVPALFADTMATFEVSAPSAIPILPSTVTAATAEAPSTVKLVRKLYFIDGSAFALSGERLPIEDALKEIRALSSELTDLDRPMQRVGKAIDAENRRRRRRAVRMLGCASISPSVIHPLTPWRYLPDFGSMGRVAAIGSGMEDLLAFCSQAAEMEQLRGHTPPERALLLSALINGTRLAQEIAGDELSRSGWGAYVEWAWLDAAGRWNRGPPTLHLFLKLVENLDGLFELQLFDRMIAYDPGGLHGRILSVSRSDVVHSQDFILEDMLSDTPPSEVPAAREFWHQWRPEVGVTTVMYEAGYGKWATLVSYAAGPERLAESYVYRWDGDNLEFGHSQELRAELLEVASAQAKDAIAAAGKQVIYP